MRKNSIVLYASLALNVALLVLVAWPHNEVVFGQVASTVGAYAAVSARSGAGVQDALWLANRTTGQLAIYMHVRDTASRKPIQLVETRDLRDDLDERQIGNLMLTATNVSDSRAIVFVIDTDSRRMVAYEYSHPNRTVTLLQQVDLTGTLAAPSTTEASSGQ